MKLREVTLEHDVRVPGAGQEAKKHFRAEHGFDIQCEGGWVHIAKADDETSVPLTNVLHAKREAKAAKK